MPSQDIFVRAAMPVLSAQNPDSSRRSNFAESSGDGYDIEKIEASLKLLNEAEANEFRFRIARGEDLDVLGAEVYLRCRLIVPIHF